ncbi:MAG TPA: class I SAM-dependent methyltransferase [Chitinophagaceae bacterium]|nr:class I SAM-dependent methyltransferase [Chitinophagaceae bacterium]
MDKDIVALAPTKRFSNRVDNYVKYRPSYPAAMLSFFESTLGLKKEQRIADIGSGTGLFAKPLLQQGYSVVCIEPNEDMRKAGEQQLSSYPGFISRKHTAEQTGLRSHSVDLITVAQAFHWMDPDATKKEFARILKPGGHIVLAWNLRLHQSPFMKAHHALKEKYRTEATPARSEDESTLRSFFEPAPMQVTRFENNQRLTFEELKGQLLSASYIPLPGHPQYEEMIAALAELFVTHNQQGFVTMEHETKLYWNGH